ncbi:hypothetical protein ACIGJO_35275 [Streptomyces sp. NPDC079020]|uniref:hypothetical protein n=1 Tax=Streptomyces sp. NPDC079020 TaxID=3365722 RepID=UPI0037D2A27C
MRITANRADAGMNGTITSTAMTGRLGSVIMLTQRDRWWGKFPGRGWRSGFSRSVTGSDGSTRIVEAVPML